MHSMTSITGGVCLVKMSIAVLVIWRPNGKEHSLIAKWAEVSPLRRGVRGEGTVEQGRSRLLGLSSNPVTSTDSIVGSR